MESLIKHRRVRFSGLGQDRKEESNTSRERRIPPQPPKSFQGDKKSQNWFQRQFSRQMSHDYDFENIEFVTAIGATAFAIYSEEEARSMSRVKTRKDEPFMPPDSTGISRRFSDKQTKETGKSRLRQGDRTPSFVRPAPPPIDGNQKQKGSQSKETKADARKKAKMEEIRKRYEKTNSEIVDWENQKKRRAKSQMEIKERELDQRRARNLKHYKGKIAWIDSVAEGARAQVEERRKHELSEMEKRAKKIRSSGRSFVCCFCF